MFVKAINTRVNGVNWVNGVNGVNGVKGGFEGPNPFLKAFLGSFPLQLRPILKGKISKVQTLFSRHI